MSDGQVSTITIHLAIPSDWGFGNVIGGKHVTEANGRYAARLFLKDREGQRHITVREGDRIAFAGQSWCVTKVYEPVTDARGPVVTLTEI
ncbi:hypothetical protein OHB26_23590 [Nocardia sp. NBC_01503]|uniref:hypothetical protein n=1 Tax=Nocardia sp. NBC_01503 TaxID=2975997 RepID=UPI002E7B1B51|nr:hypothetical protein [Nocardia sp. NBC_01503]WTL29942.1 hypothetical protein OHB26_23590 [Nocardia sp. NBC_01503]